MHINRTNYTFGYNTNKYKNIMNSPFQFGKIVTGENFINRKNDIRRVQKNINAGINTILISPRRWGKSSLMKQVEFANKDRKIRFAFIDFFNIRSEEDFFNHYVKVVLKCGINKRKELLNAGKDFFKRVNPSFSFGIDPVNDFTVKLNWNEAWKSKDEIINLPETIASNRGIKIVVCIDEFQNISKLPEYIKLEQELRSYWQHHQNTVYCLYGSRRHMMLEIFKQESRAFYRFGDLFLLDKIAESHWKKFIQKSFEKSNKEISDETIDSLIKFAENNPDYLQQLCHNLYSNSGKRASKKDLYGAMDLVLRSNRQTYYDICDSLSNTQINLLKAILSGERKLTSASVMKKFNLGTPRNVSKNKQMLESKDILEIHGSDIIFNDPVFKYWLADVYL